MVDIRSPILAVDVVIEFDSGEVVLIKRKYDPYKGYWALPGGMVEIGETVEQAAIREVREETGLDISISHLVGVYSEPNRDPRNHVVSIAFHATPLSQEIQAASDAAEVMTTNDFSNIKLAFDHEKIIKDALKENL